ncbi:MULTISPECIES: histidine phosphatase family protein [Deinococcus]|nr:MULTISPECIES: histidine phosphatase family protein [Deinococcus]MCY1702801.1 phosphoglycerate mutase family protein [Deinococcus sp. SL84]
MSRTLHLVRHAKPALDPARPSHEWHLAPGALDGLPALLETLSPRPEVVVCSTEPKAQATAEALAAALGVSCCTMLGLHEQLRYTVPLYSHPSDFQAAMRRFFQCPAEVVSGEESANIARERFTAALHAVMAVHLQSSVAVVTHGTVRSLYVAHANTGLDAYTLWQQQQLLDTLSVEWPGGRLLGLKRWTPGLLSPTP